MSMLVFTPSFQLLVSEGIQGNHEILEYMPRAHRTESLRFVGRV